MATIDPQKYAALEKENAQLKSEIQSIKVSRSIETNFYKFGGKHSSDEDMTTYFAIVEDYALRFIKLDERGKVSFIDPADGLPLKNSSGKDFSMRDLMGKIKSSKLFVNHFDSKNAQDPAAYSDRELLRQIKDPAARLARARELGIQ